MKTRNLLLLLAVTLSVALLAFLQVWSFTASGFTVALRNTNLTAIVTALYAGLVYLQLCQMDAQHKSQEKVAQDQLNELKGQAEQARRSAVLAERSARAAEQTAWTAKQDMTIRQRALVVADNAMPGLRRLGLLPLTAGLQLTNLGATPALNLSFVYRLYLCREFQSPPHHLVAPPIGSLAPQRTHTVSTELDPPPSDTEAFEEGQLKLFFSGIVSYDDVFGGRQSTSWAFQYLPSSKAFVRCNFHNDMHDGLAERSSKPEP